MHNLKVTKYSIFMYRFKIILNEEVPTTVDLNIFYLASLKYFSINNQKLEKKFEISYEWYLIQYLYKKLKSSISKIQQ